MVHEGELFRVKPGCGDEGMLGIIIKADSSKGIRFHTVLLSDGTLTEANEHWLEVISSVNFQPQG
jgi:hypothetical protein